MLLPALSRSLPGLLRSNLSTSTCFTTVIGTQTRAFASVLPDVPVKGKRVVVPKSLPPTPEGSLRPHYGVEVNPNHGLYGFFRRVEKDGRVEYMTVEPMDHAKASGSRSWMAAELRRKSFKDLHTLWYVLLRERNLLATQRHEAVRLGIAEMFTAGSNANHKVRKSMARIKYVINERRLAYEDAIKILHERRETKLATRRRRRLFVGSIIKAASKARRAKRAEARRAKKQRDSARQKLIKQNTPVARGTETKSVEFALGGLFASGQKPSSAEK